MSASAKNFFGLSPDYSGRDESRVAIVPVPYEAAGGEAHNKGAKDGPKAVLDASQQVELFDDELWIEPFKIGVHTTDSVKIDHVDNGTDKPFHQLSQVVQALIDGEKFPIIVGGEQPISLGGVKGCIDKYADLSVLRINAHCDLRASFEAMSTAMPLPLFKSIRLCPSR